LSLITPLKKHKNNTKRTNKTLKLRQNNPRQNAASMRVVLELRIPTSLHRRVVETAKTEGISANQFLLHLISLGIGNQNAGINPCKIRRSNNTKTPL